MDLTARRTSVAPRRFRLIRDEDETGISGVGVVAYGVAFDDGNAVTRWNSDVAQTCVWASMDEVEAVHGHGGRTRIEWIDPEQSIVQAAVNVLAGIEYDTYSGANPHPESTYHLLEHEWKKICNALPQNLGS